MRLCSRAYLDTEQSEQPHIKLAWLAGDADGLIALSGGPNGPLDRGDRRRAGRARAVALRGIAAAVRRPPLYRVAAPRHGGRAAGRAGADRACLCARHCRSSPPTSRSSPTREDYEAHDALLCIAEGRLIADSERRQLTPEHRFKTRAEMAALFADLPEALAATVEIAERCAFRPRTLAPILPRFSAGHASGQQDAAAQAQRGRGAAPRRARRTGAPPGAASDRARPHRRGLSRPARLRARRHREHEIRRLFPHRRRFHPMGEGAGHSGRAGPRLRRGLAGRLRAHHHRSRSDPLRAPVRALPQSRTRLDAGLRRRFLPGPARRSDPLRAGEIRPRPGGADHHLRHLAGARRAARCRARAADAVRAGRQALQAGAAESDQSRHARAARSRTSRGCRPSATRPGDASAPSTSRRSSKACIATPRPTPPASSSATGR